MKNRVYSLDTPKEILNGVMLSYLYDWFQDNSYRFLIGNEFAKNIEIYNVDDYSWTAIVLSKAEVDISGILNISLSSVESITATFHISFKNEVITSACLTFYLETNKFELKNKEELITSINRIICPKCKNPPTKCNCLAESNSQNSQPADIDVSNIEPELNNRIEVFDETGLFSEEKIKCSIPDKTIDEIIIAINKSFGFKKDLLKQLAVKITQENPKISEEELANQLIAQSRKG